MILTTFIWLIQVGPLLAIPLPLNNPLLQQQQKEFILAGLQDNNNRLRQGIVRAKGFVSNSEKSRGGGELMVYIVFDQDSQRVRFDNRMPAFHLSPENPTPHLGISGGKSVKTAEYVINAPFDDKGEIHSVWIEKPDAAINETIKPFDFRTLGLQPAANLRKGNKFEIVIERLKKISKTFTDSVKEENNSIYRFDRTYNNQAASQTRHTIWFDGNRGFTPSRFESRDSVITDGVMTWSEPTQYAEVSWRKVHDVWVVSTAKIVEGKSPNNVNTQELAFDWESVNIVPDSKLFTEDGLGLKAGTYTMLDYRLGEPILLKREGQIGPATSKLIVSPRAEPWSAYWPYTIGLLVACVPLVALYWWYRRWKNAELSKL